MLSVKCIQKPHLSHWEPFQSSFLRGPASSSQYPRRYLCRPSRVLGGSKIITTVHTEYNSECRTQSRETDNLAAEMKPAHLDVTQFLQCSH